MSTRLARLAHAALLAAGLAGCALAPPGPAPPEPGSTRTRAAEPPRVYGVDGQLPPGRARQILRRLEQQDPGDLLARHLRATEGLVKAPLRVGNAVELLIDGPATHQAMYAAIDAARDTVNLETYILQYDIIGQAFADLLIRVRERGVHVNVLYDGVGSIGTPPAFFDRLRAHGVQVCEYNPVNPLHAHRGWKVNNRNHRKQLIVDGRIGFTGGINISGVYRTGSFSLRRRKPVEEGWRDTQVEVRGPAARDMQRLFVDSWREQCGEPCIFQTC
jgi:cardiolipin synthase